MKTIYLIRHAKSDWSDGTLNDFERGLRKSGKKDLKTISSYFALQKIKPDLVLSSSALRAQTTADKLTKKIGYKGPIHYMEELYLTRPEKILDTLALQDDVYKNIFLVGHNPELTELANIFVEDNIFKLPTLSILAIYFEIDEWSKIREKKGNIDFFIQPKQFKYYVPKQIRTTLG
ncbi:MAG: Putative phosphohistidine phosphatase, SixA [uncultured Sulfurovum sp.]|uniref:Phosphohistidine phosphatase, SixA n=1 Tax=uncultured Sulfurovum sp. TaxID=269237 RepID=A0A6S6UIR0_9BACT|nr:MAG: Putative phosphohistidine phosphatase, SixA [uncultured Sulfurovum sp.]